MTVPFDVQCAAVVVVIFYLGGSGFLAHPRNARTWDSLTARLGDGMAAGIFTAGPPDAMRAAATDEDLLSTMKPRRGAWAVYERSGVVLEMADYAERNCSSIDPVLLDTLRNDAMRNRLFALKSLVFSA